MNRQHILKSLVSRAFTRQSYTHRWVTLSVASSARPWTFTWHVKDRGSHHSGFRVCVTLVERESIKVQGTTQQLSINITKVTEDIDGPMARCLAQKPKDWPCAPRPPNSLDQPHRVLFPLPEVVEEPDDGVAVVLEGVAVVDFGVALVVVVVAGVVFVDELAAELAVELAVEQVSASESTEIVVVVVDVELVPPVRGTQSSAHKRQ